MKTQIEQLKAAKRFYIIPLNNPHNEMSTHRYQVYCDTGNGLEVLWPSDSGEGSNSKELLPYQKYTKLKQYPAFHFTLGGCGYCKKHEIAYMIAEALGKKGAEDVEYFTLNGWMPSRS